MILGELMEKEMREQPNVLASHSTGYFEQACDAVAEYRPEMVLIAARGSSDNAAVYARYLIEIHLGIPVSLAAPSVITKFGSKVQYPKCLAIGISQSGAAPDVSEVLGYLREQGHKTLAITNTPKSRVTETAEHTVLLDAGAENSIAATKTYTSSLLALAQVVRVMGGDLPDPIHHLPTDEWINTAHDKAHEAVGHLVRNSPIFCLARGYGYCTALETALKLMECALLSAKSYSTSDFEHGPKALATHGTTCVIYGDTPSSLLNTGTTIVQDPQPPSTVYTPIWNIMFGQWLALLAARARGLNPDQAQHLSKVTETL